MENYFFLTSLTIAVVAANGPLDKQDGHLKRFGEGRPNYPVEEVTGYPHPRDFFENYVIPMKPLVMRGAARISKALTLWTDDYFLAERSNFIVISEPFQEQVLHQPVKHVTFTEFVSTYNHSGHYMVNEVPPFLL